MAGHDEYGKEVLQRATNGKAILFGPSVEIDFGAGQPARIDGAIGGSIAVEIESRVSKQVRGAVLDLICHSYPKKLLILLPVHMNNPDITAAQCRYILERFCPHNSFRVVVLTGTGTRPALDVDVSILAAALEELSSTGRLSG